MAKTSVHICGCKTGSAKQHNEREKELDYVKKELTPTNEKLVFDDRPLAEIQQEAAAFVKAKTGRKMQAKANPLIEGVVVIESSTTIEQLKNFCNQCHQKWGITPVSIYIHRDEGHDTKNGWKPNLHAHIIWNQIIKEGPKAGKSARLTKIDCAHMQTILANSLGMERGIKSSTKHLDVLAYKARQRQTEVEKLETSISELSTKIDELSKARAAKEAALATIKAAGEAGAKSISAIGNAVVDAVSGSKSREISRLSAANKELSRQIDNVQNTAISERDRADRAEHNLKILQRDLDMAREARAKAEEKLQIAEQQFANLGNAYMQVEELGLNNVISAKQVFSMVRDPNLTIRSKKIHYKDKIYSRCDGNGIEISWCSKRKSFVFNLKGAFLKIADWVKYACCFVKDFLVDGKTFPTPRDLNQTLEVHQSVHDRQLKHWVKLPGMSAKAGEWLSDVEERVWRIAKDDPIAHTLFLRIARKDRPTLGQQQQQEGQEVSTKRGLRR